ncbi:MAG: YdcF family protein [Candidatus Omnitrophica bacterium]|nr:YdcF family protein [Candidatus Omnitrophota bacterium]
MATLAEQGNRVLFVENTGVRAPTLRDLPRLTHRIMRWMRSTKGFRKERENLFLYSPLILPFPYSSLARWVNRRLLLRALQRWMRVMAFHRPILWTFLPTPLTLDLMKELDPELTVYYCIDDLASSSPAARRISQSEPELFRHADLVFVTSQKLKKRAADYTDQVHFFPFGVDFEHYERVRRGADEIPEDLQALPRPVVGYVGGLHRWIDQDLLASVAERMPHATFALIGPAQTDLSRLARCPNVRLLGARPHHELPRYTKGFDVGIVPYRLSEYTAHVYPTKLNEYLAMGIPVIATDLPEIQRFNAAHGDVVAVARDPNEFVKAIREALVDRSSESVTRRIDVARENSWTSRIAMMSALIERKLAGQRPAGERWQEALRRLYRRARDRVFRLVVGTAAGYCLLFQSPLLWMVAEPLRMAEPARPTDAIVVFAGGVGESGKAGEGYQERVKQAAELYHQGLAPRIIFSSGYTFVFQEADIMKDLAVSLGVPSSAIFLEKQASTTYENVIKAAALLKQHDWQSLLLVSSPYHMRRAVMAWRKVAPQIHVIPTPVLESQFYAHGVGASLEQVRGILHEYLGIVYYWWKGWL